MSNNGSNPGARTGDTTNDAGPDNVTLRIVILAHGSGREDDLYLVLGLDTPLGVLKSRIQESLPQRPPPEHQRIIYQGRGLDDANEPLRSILRQDPRAGSSPYVLHLVIRQAPADSQPAPSLPTNIPQQPAVDPNLHQQQVHIQGPHPPPPDLMRIHNQLHQMQHLQHQQAMQRAQMVHFPMPTGIGQDQIRQMHQALSSNPTTGQPQAVGHGNSPAVLRSAHDPALGNILPALPSGLPASTTGINTPSPRMPHVPTPQLSSGSVPQPFTSTTPVLDAPNPSGPHTRTIINATPTTTTTMTFRITGLNPPNPLDRPSSAPGASPSADADSANRVINPMPGNVQIHAQPPPIPLGFPFPPGVQLPFPMAGMIPLAQNPFQHIIPPNPSLQPMAWLLSSPAGPQGIVFAPGHGFFNTAAAGPSSIQPTPTVAQSASQTDHTNPQQRQLVIRPPTQGVFPPAPQSGARPQPPAAGLPVPPQPREAARARPRPNNDQTELLQLIINRGWLFLRLYMFVFVFSESGTWRRILMIGAIMIFCALPQQNPLTNALQVVRRHFDNLIGPPNLPQRQPQQAQPNNQNDGQAAGRQPANTQPGASPRAGSRVAPMPTPEETARRLLERQNRRNPNPVIDALYRLEQGIVLFLASLVPGVGERHVQAREEARRIVQEEEQRRIAEAQQESQSASTVEQATRTESAEPQSEAGRRETEGGPLPDGWKTATQLHEETHGQQATSSGVDRGGRTEGEGVRSRNTTSEE